MKKYIVALSITCFCIFLIFLLFKKVQDHQPEWKGEIIESSDKIVVRNPSEPAYRDYQLELEHIFTLGNQTDENYLFYRAMDVKVDSHDNIYVLDSGNFRIQVFNPDGKYLRTIGRRGQGPGEFSNFIYNFDISEKDYLYVRSGEFITRFTSDGQYDARISIPFGLWVFFVDSKENFYGKIIEWHGETQNDRRIIARLNSEGKIEKEYFHKWRGRDEFSGDLQFFRTNDGKLIYGWSMEHLFYINHDGKDKLIEVVSAIPPLPMPEAYKKRFKEQQKSFTTRLRNAPIPEYHVFINNMIVDDYGYIWVTPTSPETEETGFIFDVFDSRGRYLYRFNLKYYPLVIRNNYLYSLRIDPEIGDLVEKVKMRNWPPR